MSRQSLTTNFQILGQILICSSGCCCGQTNLGAPPIPEKWLKKSWREAGIMDSIHLTTTGCLGPCDLTNVVCILNSHRQIWLGGITEHSQYEALLDWAKASARVGYLLDLPPLLQKHIFKRFNT